MQIFIQVFKKAFARQSKWCFCSHGRLFQAGRTAALQSHLSVPELTLQHKSYIFHASLGQDL